MLRALVIEDLLTAQGISLSTTLKRQILRSLSSAWQLGDQPSARNLPAFQQFFAAQVPPLPAGDVERLTERYLFRPEGLVELQHFFQRNKPPSPMEPVEPVVQRSPATEIYREQFIHGLMAVIQRESPNTEEPREVARRFYSLFRRGACNYAQVVFELSAGADPYTLLGTIYTRELKRSNNQVPQRKGDHIRPTFQLSDEPHRRLIVVRNTGVFDRWITDMPDEVQARIRGRLVRVELGNLGDWSAISNRIHELRCDIGPGYRLYFSRASECEFLFLCGGNKDSQARDIRRAQLLLSLFKG
jgi:putative addiction module killer protein